MCFVWLGTGCVTLQMISTTLPGENHIIYQTTFANSLENQQGHKCLNAFIGMFMKLFLGH